MEMNSQSEISMNKDKLSQEKLLEERIHKCTICQKGFTRKPDLNRHFLSHSGIKPHQCTTCNKQFRQMHDLNRHMLLHSGEKPHECPTCHKKFPQKSYLDGHLRMHSEEKQFPCSTCSKKFTKRSNLNTHMLRHSGEKPHECPTCQKSFTLKGDLNRHLRIHSGNKPYECLTCQKLFAVKGNLNEHLKIHVEDHLFECQICSQQFRHKSSLIRHMKIHPKKKQDTSVSTHHLQQSSRLIDNLNVDGKDLETFGSKSREYEIKPSTSMTYFENVKNEIDDGLEQKNSDFCFEVPLMKEESNPEDVFADEPKPSCSYQNILIKDEPDDQFDDSCEKEETQ